MLLSVRADEFKLSGTPAHMKEGLGQLAKDIDADELVPANTHLGYKHELHDILLDGGSNARRRKNYGAKVVKSNLLRR